MLAARLLAPVLEQEPERRDAQLRVLRSWLAANGSWDATAKDLGLHRNSVRRQINALAELLDTGPGAGLSAGRTMVCTSVRGLLPVS